MAQISVREFENKVWDIEGIPIVIRAPLTAMVEDFSHKNKSPSNVTVKDWIERRIELNLNGFDFNILDVDNKNRNAHGSRKLANLREKHKPKSVSK